MNILSLIDRTHELFVKDIEDNDTFLNQEVGKSNFLVIGGAGSIGQAVVKEIFIRNPKKLHVVDISENNLVELVRDIRSSYGYIEGDFRTYAIDCGSIEFEAMFKNEGPYDYVLNLSALKHVRSEKDPYTIMRMIEVNILNTIKTVELSIKNGVKKYFCVSTDKAANPVNMMGASKRIMEMFLMKMSKDITISTARFANVAFSDGSLLHGFNKRLEKMQPIAAPNDVKRYFVTPKEAGQLCLLSTLLGDNRDICFPKLNEELNLIKFSTIAERYLKSKGLSHVLCESEEDARNSVVELSKEAKWPCCFFPSNTTGEKDFEEFFTNNEEVDLQRFNSLGVVKNSQLFEDDKLNNFITEINKYKKEGSWTKKDLLKLFFYLLPDFNHEEKGQYLDSKM